MNMLLRIVLTAVYFKETLIKKHQKMLVKNYSSPEAVFYCSTPDLSPEWVSRRAPIPALDF